MLEEIGDRHWRQQIERATEFLSFIDGDFRLRYVNHPQPGVGDYVGRSVFDFVDPQYHEALRVATAAARSTGLPQHYESEATGPNGATSFYSNWILPIRGEADLLAFIATDVTHGRRIEEALELSEVTLRAFVDQAPDHIMIVDRERRVEFLNRAGHGLDVGDIIGAKAETFVVAEERQKVIDAIESVLRTGEATAYEVAVELPDGIFEYSTRLGPVTREGRVDRVALITTDITDAKRAERERQRLAAQLHQSQKMEAIGQLTGGVAHDFNNLLMVIAGSLEAAKSASSPEEMQAEMEHALTTVQRAASLTQRLLAFSRKQPLSPKVVDVCELVRGMEELLERTLGETITLEVACAPKDLRAEVDAGQLETVLLNLALNARDAMPRGGQLTLRTSPFSVASQGPPIASELTPGEYVLISAADTGIGMEPHILAQAFEPFFTTKEVGRGSGLGLSVAYGFARQSGGTLEVKSEPGAGTTVLVYLPRTQQGVEEPVATPSTRGRGEAVLIVEDDDTVRRVLDKMVQGLGYATHVAGDAHEALDVLDQNPEIALMIADVVLPARINGVELTRQARLKVPSLGVLLVSGYPRDAVDGYGRLNPGVDLLPKPFRRDTLAKAIQKTLSLRSFAYSKS